MGGETLVSVFIRVRNEADALAEVLDHLAHQNFNDGVEVVVLDNESTDGSAEIALAAGARVFTLPRALFGYGRALNLGVDLCRGQIVILLSAHSIPLDEHWLSRFVAPMLNDSRIGAAYCRQVPYGTVSRLERHRFACFPEANYVVNHHRFLALCHAGVDPYTVAQFSNSAAALRRESATANPFRDLPYAEDRAFAVDHLMHGGSIAYVHEAVVSYERSMTWKSAYHVARRAQISKRLIRELAATYTGRRFSSTLDTTNRVLRAAAVGLGLLTRLLHATIKEQPGVRRRAARFAMRSTGATLGLAVGALTWRQHVETLVPDRDLFEEAQRQCRPFSEA